MELIVKILAVVIVLSILSVLLWSYVVKTQADIDTQHAAQNAEQNAAQAAAENSLYANRPIYYSRPITKVYVNDASGNSWNYWKRFYSS